MKRRNFLAALGAGLATPLASFAQQHDKIRRIGALAFRSRSTPSHPEGFYDEFINGMRDLGYVEGKNIAIEWRFADGKQEALAGLAAELVRLKPELIVTHSTPATRALQLATSTIPIVTAAANDPVGSGFAKSLARPGGNVTGLSLISIDVSQKQLELLKAMVPKLSRVAVLVNAANPSLAPVLKSVQAAGQTIGVRVFPLEARNLEEVERVIAAMKKEEADGIIILGDAFFIAQRRQIVELLARIRLPSMFYFQEDTQAGGLMSYGQNITDFYHRAATYVDKILKGAKPGDLPFEQPTKLHLAINHRTAKALGLTVPQGLLLRADKVIE